MRQEMTMKTTHHHDLAGTGIASTITIGSAMNHHDVSIAQAIAQAIADTSKASPEQSLIEASLPGHSFNQGLTELLGRLPDPSATDPSKGGDHPGASGSGIVTPADALRSLIANAFDPAGHDPTAKGDLHDDWIRPGLPSQATLQAELGLPGSGGGNTSAGAGASASGSNGSGSKGSGSLDPYGHPQQPEQGSAPPGSNDPGHNMLEGMLSEKITSETGGKKEWITNWTGSNGDRHHTVREEYNNDGSVIVTDIDKTTGVVTVDQHTEEGSGASLVKHDTTTTYDPNTGLTKVRTYDSDTDHERTVVTDSKGKIVSDSDHPKAGGGSSIPDEDHQFVVPAGLTDLMKDDVKQMHQPSHDGDDVNVAGTEIPGTVARSDVAGPVGDDKTRLLGGDRGFEGAQDGGAGGSVSPNYNGLAGAIDFGPDHDETPQTSGREERNTQHAIHTDPAAAAQNNGQHGDQHGGGGGQQSANQGLTLVETAAQQAAHKLQQAVEQHHDDPWGTQGRYQDAWEARNASPTSLAETAGQKAAQKLADAVGHHDGPSQHEPIKPHEKFAVADIGQGPGPGGGSHADAGSAFADLIRAAQNPVQSGIAEI